MLATQHRKQLRQLAHRLEPVVVVGERGLTTTVVNEIERALTDHELIKTRINLMDRVARRNCGRELADRCGAQIVQEIGKVLVLYRQNPAAVPKLSNVARRD